MKVNYNHITPVAQQDDYSCWAASLSFWKHAVFNQKKPQQQIIDKYNHLSDDDGSMGEEAIVEIMADNNMYPTLADPARLFTPQEVKSQLEQWGPLYVAYKSTRQRFKHVVVIHGIVDVDTVNPRVWVMDPGCIDRTDASKYHGRNKLKGLGEYNWFDKVIYGMK
jgi:hypothetical protein